MNTINSNAITPNDDWKVMKIDDSVKQSLIVCMNMSRDN